MKRSGRLYYIAKTYGDFYERGESDFCSFSRAITKGIFTCVALTAACALLLSPIVCTLAYMLSGILHGFHHPEEFTSIAIAITCAYIILFCGAVYSTFRTERKYAAERERFELEKQGVVFEPPPPAEPSVLALWYRSFKEKTCFNIKFHS